MTNDSKDITEYNDLISYLNKESINKPSVFELISTIFLQLILTIVYYYTAFSDLYLCFCFYKNSETVNFLLTSLWFFLPQLILITGELKVFYMEIYLQKREKINFFYKSTIMFIVSLFKLNVFYGFKFEKKSFKYFFDFILSLSPFSGYHNPRFAFLYRYPLFSVITRCLTILNFKILTNLINTLSNLNLKKRKICLKFQQIKIYIIQSIVY